MNVSAAQRRLATLTVLGVACETCEAPAGTNCRTRSSNHVEPHRPRIELFEQTKRELQKLIAWEKT